MYLYFTDKNHYMVATRIYDISYDSNGYPLFLIYLNGQWERKSAKYFSPMIDEDDD